MNKKSTFNGWNVLAILIIVGGAVMAIWIACKHWAEVQLAKVQSEEKIQLSIVNASEKCELKEIENRPKGNKILNNTAIAFGHGWGVYSSYQKP